MTSDRVETVVLSTIADQLGVAVVAVERHMPLLALDGMESIALLRVVGEIEDTCGVAVPDDTFVDPVSAQDLIDIVLRLSRAEPAAPAPPPPTEEARDA